MILQVIDLQTRDTVAYFGGYAMAKKDGLLMVFELLGGGCRC